MRALDIDKDDARSAVRQRDLTTPLRQILFADDIQSEENVCRTDDINPISDIAADRARIDGDVVTVNDRHAVLAIRNSARAGRIEPDDASAHGDARGILDDDSASGKAVDDHAPNAAARSTEMQSTS